MQTIFQIKSYHGHTRSLGLFIQIYCLPTHKKDQAYNLHQLSSMMRPNKKKV